jgi:hypothetical protein
MGVRFSQGCEDMRVPFFETRASAKPCREALKSRSRRAMLKTLCPIGCRLALVTLTICLLSRSLVTGEGLKPKNAAEPSKKKEKKSRKPLSGAELYAMHCNRCHPERYSPERTAEQWKTILLHMRTRANLPAEHAKAILKFLQEDSGK